MQEAHRRAGGASHHGPPVRPRPLGVKLIRRTTSRRSRGCTSGLRMYPSRTGSSGTTRILTRPSPTSPRRRARGSSFARRLRTGEEDHRDGEESCPAVPGRGRTARHNLRVREALEVLELEPPASSQASHRHSFGRARVPYGRAGSGFTSRTTSGRTAGAAATARTSVYTMHVAPHPPLNASASQPCSDAASRIAWICASHPPRTRT
jgi:hypothetical protein